MEPVAARRHFLPSPAAISLDCSGFRHRGQAAPPKSLRIVRPIAD